MVKLSKTAILATFLIPSVAMAQVDIGDQIGSSETAIRASLETKGYVITEIETEDGEIEVEATIGTQSFEFEISPDTGLVLALYQEDDEEEHDDDDDDDDESSHDDDDHDDDDDDDEEKDDDD